MFPKKRRLPLKALLTLILYLIIPLTCLVFILVSYPELPRELMLARIYWVIPTAMVIIILAHLSTLYQKGDTKRFLLSIGFTVATMIWMFGLLGGGVTITSQWNDYEFSLHMNNYIILIISVAAFNIMYYILEWKTYQKDNVSFLIHEEKKMGTTIE